jgi:3-oxoacid CoA-transferase subunit B
MPLTRQQMAARAARELVAGSSVNLGIGLPTLVPNYLAPGVDVFVQPESRVLGVGTLPYLENVDPKLINAAQQAATGASGASYHDSPPSFGMVRSGRGGTAILGAMQVSRAGDIVNLTVPGKVMKGIGGAMDISNGAERVIVLMEHVAKDGSHKIVDQCTLPLAGTRCVDRIITDLAVIDVTEGGLVLRELAPGVTFAEVLDATGCAIGLAGAVGRIEW